MTAREILEFVERADCHPGTWLEVPESVEEWRIFACPCGGCTYEVAPIGIVFQEQDGREFLVGHFNSFCAPYSNESSTIRVPYPVRIKSVYSPPERRLARPRKVDA